MNTQEAVNLVLLIFGKMDRSERQALIKILRPMRRRLDMMYPEGIKEEDNTPVILPPGVGGSLSNSGLILPEKSQ